MKRNLTMFYHSTEKDKELFDDTIFRILGCLSYSHFAKAVSRMPQDMFRADCAEKLKQFAVEQKMKPSVAKLIHS